MATQIQSMAENCYTSKRISKSATIVVNAKIEDVFPLFGPIREKDWAEGWDPEILYSTTNLVERHMIFRTKPSNDVEDYFIWVITTFKPDQHKIEYTVSTKNRIWFINVSCTAIQSKTRAEISYTFTSLNEMGWQLSKEALQKMYANDLKDWEEALNFYLATGTLLTQA